MKYSEDRALSKLAAYCSKAERAEYDIRQKLHTWELDTEVSERIIARLKKDNFLNNERYCRSFIKDKLRFNKWGKTKIIYELKKKQIPQSIINTCFDDIDNTEFDEPLKKLLTTKEKSIKASNNYEKKMKLIRFGLGRGYSIEQIKKCLNTILEIDDDEYSDTFF